MIQASIILLLLLPLLQVCHCEFLERPSAQWTYRVPGGGTLAGRGFRAGNEIAVSPDGTTLFATADDGSLHFVAIADLRDSLVFQPEAIAGTFTECRSGVTMIYDDDNALAYLVYAVMDVPVQAGILYEGVSYDASRTSILSRLLAVNLDGTIRWSLPLSGAVAGKPVQAAQKDKLYVVHNVPNFIGSSPTRGKVSVILLQQDNSQPTVTASIAPLDRQGPFGPPTGATLVDGTQVVVLAEAWDSGYAADNGHVFLLKPSSLYKDFGGQGDEAYELARMSAWSVASVTRPAVVADEALQVFCGGAAARLSGWSSVSNVVAGSQENVTPTWDVTLSPSLGNASQPLLVAPILSGDHTVLYQAGTSTEMYALDTVKGDILWTSAGVGRGTVYAEPKLVELLPNTPKVYVIEGINGKVRQHDALTGTIDWTFDCRDVSGMACNDAVEADFSVAPSGNTLYYGDVFGKIVALDIAAFAASAPAVAVNPETAPPVPLEVIAVKTEAPTVGPTLATTPKPAHVPTTTAIESAEPDKTSSPSWGPLKESTPVPLTAGPTQSPIPPILFANGAATAPNGVGFDDVEPSDEREPNTEISTSAAFNEEEKANDSFFSNDIMIVLVAVCGGLALAIIVLLLAQRMRSSKRNNKKSPANHDLTGDDEDGKDWHNAQDAYEEACRKNEEETIQEIVSLAPKTPSKKGKFSKKSSKKQKKLSPVTPSTLASIEESPAECEVSFVSDTSPKNLEKSFDASLIEAKNQSHEVSLTDTPLPAKSVVQSKLEPVNRSVEAATSVPTELISVEVVAKQGVGKPPKPAGRVKSPEVPTESNDSGDIMSVDGSLYLDDDSYLQSSKVEVASLSQFSAASSRDAGSEIGTNYSLEGHVRYEAAHCSSPDEPFMQPPRVSSPLLRPLSPAVADYFRRNQSPLAPSPTTPGGFLQAERTETMSPSPVTPPSEGGDSPAQEREKALDKDSLRSGRSARQGGPGDLSSRGRQKVSDTSASDRSRSCSPSIPRPPVEADRNDEPEDAWNSFLFELAKAEREFFNPALSSKGKKKNEKGRPQSPPPPPPPDSPPASPSRGVDPPM